MSFSIPQCVKCAHYHREDLEGNTCDAFPSGVPSEILLNQIDHTVPYRDDLGIQFEPRADWAPPAVEE